MKHILVRARGEGRRALQHTSNTGIDLSAAIQLGQRCLGRQKWSENRSPAPWYRSAFAEGWTEMAYISGRWGRAGWSWDSVNESADFPSHDPDSVRFQAAGTTAEALKVQVPSHWVII